eukprot:Gb_06450 [translate_table: standard]
MAMFGSTSPIEQSSSNPFGGTQSSLEQTNNPFNPKPFGNSPFGSSMFGSTSSGVFGVANSTAPAFGVSSASAFGTSVFGQKPLFGGFISSSGQADFGNAFSQTQITSRSQSFGSTATTFGTTSQSTFGTTSTPAFGSSTTPAFGMTNTSFWASSAPIFGASSSGSFGFGSTSSSSAFGGASNPLFTSNKNFKSTFGTQSSSYGSHSATMGYGSLTISPSPFGGQRGGSRVTSYRATSEADGVASGKLHSISAMPVYKEKMHEELRWEDYKLGDKGGLISAGQSGLVSSQTSSQNSFSQATSSSIIAPKTPGFESIMLGSSSGSVCCTKFGPSTSFGLTSSMAGFSSTSGFVSTTTASLFPLSSLYSSSQNGLCSSTSVFGSSPEVESHPTFVSSSSFGSQLSGLFQSSTPAFSLITAGLDVSVPSNTKTLGFGTNLFPCNTIPSLVPQIIPTSITQQTSPMFSVFQPSTSAPNSGAFSFGQSPPATSHFGGTSVPVIGQGSYGHLGTETVLVATQVPVKNPFGTLQTMPQVSIDRNIGTTTIQYGISSMPVIDKPIQVRTTSLLTPRHVTQRSRTRMQARRYNSKNDSPKISFFSDTQEAPTSPKESLFIPRDNPRDIFVQKPDQSPSIQAMPNTKEMPSPVNDNGTMLDDMVEPAGSENYFAQEPESHTQSWSCLSIEDANLHDSALSPKPVDKFPLKSPAKQNDLHKEHNHRGYGYISISGHRAGEAAIAYEHGADIEALMPKLRHSDYYTEPKIQELAAQERAKPGYCRQVKDFVVGRRGYGSVKFFGETDVRRLDLESIIQFNKCEVNVYTDESKKPHVGVGLNKPAEISLLNVKCMDKKTGKPFSEGPEVEKFIKRLKRKTEEQEAEFISYDPCKGEWKFWVTHFSKYCLDIPDRE